MRAILYAMVPTGTVEFTLLPGQAVTVGRSPETDCTVAHDTVSSKHFSIVYNGPGFELANYSRFGTFIGTRKVEGLARLESGQSFIAGEIEFKVVEEMPEDATMAPSQLAEQLRKAKQQQTLPVQSHDIEDAQPVGTVEKKADSSSNLRPVIIGLGALVVVILVVAVAAKGLGPRQDARPIRESKEADFTDDAWAKVEVFCAEPKQCVANAKDEIRRANDLYDDRGLADRNLFEAVRASAKAVAYVKKADRDAPPGLFAEAADLRKRLGTAMNEEVKALVFDFRRTLRTKDFVHAKELVQRLRKMFPDRDSLGRTWARNMGRAMEKCRRSGGEACQR